MKKALPAMVTALLLAQASSAFAATDDMKVALAFEAVVGGKPFACGQSYDAIGSTKSRITPSDLRFYVSEVELLDSAGKATPLVLDQDEIWQYKNLALLDFEDGTGPCRNGNSGLHKAVTGTAPKGDYKGVRFTLGVPFDLNHGDPTIAPSPLNLTAMFWAWQSGYRFVKIDMATSGQPQLAEGDGKPAADMKEKLATLEKIAAAKAEAAKTGKPPARKPAQAAGFSVHLGSTGCASSSLTLPPSECANPNRVTVTFDTFDVAKNVVVADVASLLQDTNVDVNAPDSAPGCMSAVNDGDCPGVMAAFGLPFGGKPAAPQRFFTVR
jgi:hypothetical protein